MTNWLDFPVVEALSPEAKNDVVHYQVCDEYCTLNAAIHRRTPILQLWAHVVGTLPPINNAGLLQKRSVTPTLCTLKDATACFRGVMRPYDGEENGDSILVYVLAPPVSIAYEPSMVCVARAVPMPSGTVMTVQVRPTESLQIGDYNATGTITRIETVFADESEPSLPQGFQTRYRERLWR